MKTNLFIILTVIIPNFLFGLSDSAKTKRIGFIGTFDIAYNFQDKILNPGIGRKMAVGLSLTNKKREFIGFATVGFKGWKINLYSPTFRESFINDVKQNYVPINGISEDSLIGAKMNSSPRYSLWGTYSQFFQVGFVWNKKMKPTISFYVGYEEFLLHDDSFAHYEDPKHGDIDYVGMQTTFYEFKVGCTIPIKKLSGSPSCLNLNLGYKWVDYGTLTFNKTSLNAYTTGALENKYNTCGKITLSISYIIWSNWD